MVKEAGDIHQDCLHACGGGAEVIHGIDVADVEALFGSGVHALEGLAENFRVRLFVADQAGVGDGTEAASDAASCQHIFDSAIRIGYDRDLVLLADLVQLLGGAGANLVPVGGVADAGDQLIAGGVVFEAEFGEQLGVEHPPEAVVGAAVGGHHAVETILGAAFQVAQVFGLGHKAAVGERRVNAAAIGEEQGVADVEEDEFGFRAHGFFRFWFHCPLSIRHSAGVSARWGWPNELN